MNRRFDDKLIWGILNFWPVFLGVVTLIGSLFVMQYRVSVYAEVLRRNGEEHKEFTVRIARLETISEMIPEMRTDIKRLLVKIK
jgi:hypothetical protein